MHRRLRALNLSNGGKWDGCARPGGTEDSAQSREELNLVAAEKLAVDILGKICTFFKRQGTKPLEDRHYWLI